MLNGRLKKQHDIKFILLVILITLIVISNIFIFNHFLKKDHEIKDRYIQNLNHEYIVALSVYSQMSELIFKTKIDNDFIKSIFYEGVKAKEPELKKRYRIELYKQLMDFYYIIIKYNFRQLHFHEADNTSFLRFHRPSKFGDDLTGIRDSVEFVNKNKKYISGFEEGKIFNGYRFVYPLSYNEEHIGSVEISVSMKTIIDILKKHFKKDAQFILLKEQIQAKTFTTEQDNYKQWHIDKRFVLDKGISPHCLLDQKISPEQIRIIQNKITGSLKQKKPFTAEITINDTDKLLIFKPILNFKNKAVAYIFSLQDHKELKAQHKEFIFVFIGSIFLIFMLIVFTIFYRLSQKSIEKIAMYDYLTKTYSRAVIFKKLTAEINRFKRYGKPFSLIMLDIDHFKLINDEFGHQTGDKVLHFIASLIINSIRETDYIGRYGGEEFLIILSETSKKNALFVAEKIRKLISENKYNNTHELTISCGVTEINKNGLSVDDWIEIVDQNLYTAKKTGRNRVVSD